MISKKDRIIVDEALDKRDKVIKVEKVREEMTYLNDVIPFAPIRTYKIITKSYKASYYLVNYYVRKKTSSWQWEKDREIEVKLFTDFEEVFPEILEDFIIK